MADEEMLTQDAGASRPRGRSRLLAVGALVFLLCAAGSYFAIRHFLAPPAQAGPQTLAREDTVLVDLGEFVTNVRDSGGMRYLKAQVYIAVSKKVKAEALEEEMPRLKDAVLAILAAQTVEDLEISRRDALRQRIAERLSEELGDKGPVAGVYFTTFILQ